MACSFIPLHDNALILLLSTPHWWLLWLITLRYARAQILTPHALTKDPCRSTRFLLLLGISEFPTAFANCMRFWLLVAILSPVWGSYVLLNWVRLWSHQVRTGSLYLSFLWTHCGLCFLRRREDTALPASLGAQGGQSKGEAAFWRLAVRRK